MNIVEHTLARRYAAAYIRAFAQELTSNDMQRIKEAHEFFTHHKKALFFLTLPTIAYEKKLQVMETFFKNMHLHASVARLLELLIRDKRVLLWCDVLASITRLYNEKNNIIELAIESYPELDTQGMQAVQQFFARKTKSDIIYTYRVVDDLIAGVRAKTDNLLWEYSVAKKLRAVRLSLIQSYKG